MKKNRITAPILLIGLMLISFGSMSQCYIKSTNQSQGHVTYYLDPELVSQSDEMGTALSVQMVANKYYLAVTYQFANQEQPVEEKIALSLQNGYTLELDMYTMEVGSAGGVELCMAVFFLESEQMNYFKNSMLAEIVMRTQDGVKHTLPVTSNKDVLIRQLKCFKR